jgi:hypothetical protein
LSRTAPKSRKDATPNWSAEPDGRENFSHVCGLSVTFVAGPADATAVPTQQQIRLRPEDARMCADVLVHKKVPIVREVDVLVCGGGSAGAVAAIAAARQGARTLVVESGFALGGTATSGMLARFGPFHDQRKFILGGLPWEILTALVEMGGAREPKPAPRSDKVHYWLPYWPETLKVLLDALASDAGVEVLYDARAAEPLVEDGAVRGAIIADTNGLEAIRAGVVIDATGDADLAAAGAAARVGRDSDGLTQPVSLAYYLHGMDHSAAREYLAAHKDQLKQIRKAESNGAAPWSPGVYLSPDNYMHPDAVHFNVDHVHRVNASDPWQRSEASVRARRQVWSHVDFLRRNVPPCKHAYLGATAALLGVRETRRILGEYELTAEDVIEARDFPDGISRYHCYVDIHSIDPDLGRGERYGLEPPAGESYGVPYRCLLPAGIEGLLVAGRCISATHEALASVRMIPSCMAMGQAAGTAAALCSRENISPRDLDPARLRNVLEQQGVIL